MASESTIISVQKIKMQVNKNVFINEATTMCNEFPPNTTQRVIHYAFNTTLHDLYMFVCVCLCMWSILAWMCVCLYIRVHNVEATGQGQVVILRNYIVF